MPRKTPANDSADKAERSNFLLSIAEKEIIEFFDGFMQLQGFLIREEENTKKSADLGKTLFKWMVRFFDKSGEDFLSISELHNSVQINDIQLSSEAQNESVVAAFVIFMLEKNLRTIRIERAATHSLFMEFMQLLAQTTPLENLEKLLGVKNIKTISVEHQEILLPDENSDIDLSIFDDNAWAAHSPASTRESFPAGDISKKAVVPSNIQAASESAKPELAAESASGKRLRPLRIRVTVGAHLLEGAMVRIIDKDVVIKEALSAKEILTELTPGEYEIQVIFDKYQTKRRVRIPYDEQLTDVLVDMQKVFDY